MFNERLIQILTMIACLRALQNKEHNRKAYERVIDNIKRHNKEIQSLDEASSINGVGSTILSNIRSIIYNNDYSKTGIYELDNSDIIEKLYVMSELLKIHGISYIRASQLYDQGIRSIDQIPNANVVNQVRIPRDVIDRFNSMLEQFFKDSGIFFVITGSYRRGLPNSKDIDVLFYNTVPNYGREIVTQMMNRGIISKFLSFGETEFEGEVTFEGYTIRIDFIFITDFQEVPYYMLYFTGNKTFNINMREKARNMGYNLTNNEMTYQGQKIIVNDEADIFNILQIPYHDPTQRNY